MSSFRASIISCILGLAISLAHAASFDCNKAGSGIERLICADDYLGKLEERVAATYKRLLAEAPKDVAAKIRSDQRRWIRKIRDKCVDDFCLLGAYGARIRELEDMPESFDCWYSAQTTIEMDACGRSKLDSLETKMNTTFQALLKVLESPDCCDSNDHNAARKLAIEAQAHWLKFREVECGGHYETISGGTLRGSFFLNCATSLTADRIEQLSHWGTVDLVRRQKSDAMNK